MRTWRFCRLILTGAAMAAAMGCLSCGPSNIYEISMDPNDGSLDRQLTAWMEGGSHMSGEPTEKQVPPEILQTLAGKYPRRITADPNAARQTFAGKFVGKLPGELGGAGEYRVIHTLMGSAAGYVERFAGADDLTWQLDRINLAADTITDVLSGYLASRLDKQPGFEKLRKFMDTDFRRDLKNLTIYLWSTGSGLVTSEDNIRDIRARVVLYLIEHDYIHYEHVIEFARLLTDSAISEKDKAEGITLTVRRLLARKMGIDEADKQLAFVSDPNEVAESFERFVKTSDICRNAAERWREQSASWPTDKGQEVNAAESQPASAPVEPDPMEVLKCAGGVLGQSLYAAVFPQISLFMHPPDGVNLTLKLPAGPLVTNGNWDGNSSRLTWLFASKDKPLSHICYAAWASSDAAFQKAHFGRVVLDGQELAVYCLWHKGLTANERRRWDGLLKAVRPGTAEEQLSRYCAEHPEPPNSVSLLPWLSSSHPYVACGAAMILDVLAQPGR